MSETANDRTTVDDGCLFPLSSADIGLPRIYTCLVNLTEKNTIRAKFRANDVIFELKVVGNRGTADQCCEDLMNWLLDAIGCKIFIGDSAELLLVHPCSRGGVWVCRMFAIGKNWSWHAICVDEPPFVSTSYALPENPDQQQYLLETHEVLIDLIGRILCEASQGPPELLLRVRVDPKEHWFLRFPLGVFAKFKLKGFERYFACQWIVTQRTISSIVAAQMEMERELGNTVAFLSGVHVVINTYGVHRNASDAHLLERGFDLLVELLNNYQNLTLPSRQLSLKWTMNPTWKQLSSILQCADTRFFFADFEADGGYWTLGDGPHRCHKPCDHERLNASGDRFDLEVFEGRLKHIRLMRVFHCNSLFNPYNELESEPADAAAIGSKLLASGAFFVEGSVTKEPVIDFICSMLTLLLGRADLRTILWARSIEGGWDLSRLITKANDLLSTRGFSLIPTVMT